MKIFKEFFVSLSEMVKSWKQSTICIIVGVIAAIAFYSYASFLKANKSDSTKILGFGTFFTFLICLGLIILIVYCLKY